MSAHPFDATEELNVIRQHKHIKRRMRYGHSRLMRLRAEPVALRLHGASYRELACWLRQRRIKISHTTVMRYLSKLPELSEVMHAKLP